MASHILIVDDSPEDRSLISESLRTSVRHYLVAEAEDGEGAMTHATREKVDCILLDYQLSNEDGMDVLAKLKSAGVTCPIVMLTGRGDEELAAFAIKAGATDYLAKQFMTSISLRLAIDNAILQAERAKQKAAVQAERDSILALLSSELLMPLKRISGLGNSAIDCLHRWNADGVEAAIEMQGRSLARVHALLNGVGIYWKVEGEGSEPEPVTLSEVMQLVISRFEAGRIKVSAKVLPVVLAHNVEIRDLFRFLFECCCDGRGSAMTRINVDARPSAPGTATICVYAQSGFGIASGELPTIADLFLPDWDQGDSFENRLRLAICRKIVERARGAISLDQPDDGGIAFLITLPVP